MRILAVDDERLVRKGLIEELNKVFPNAEIDDFEDGMDAISFLKGLAEQQESIAYAFLDIKLRGMTGIELAKEIKGIMPNAKIVFCTGYSEYAFEAYTVFAKGYLMKPVTAEDIERMLDAMDGDWRNQLSDTDCKLTVQTFGNFEVFVEDKPLVFKREKAKELLAYLVDRNGASATSAEIAAVLWEDKPFDRSVKSQYSTVVASLKETLREAKAEKVLVKTWNHIAIDRDKIKCDVYDFLEGDVSAINTYRGEYMTNYSWAEFTNALLQER